MQEQYGKVQRRLTCLYQQPAYLLCTNKLCKEADSVICANAKCKCQKQIHNTCGLIKAQPFIEKLFQKQKRNHPYLDRLNFLQNAINNLIQQFSIERERIINELKYLGLRQPQIDFLNRTQCLNVQENTISGSKIQGIIVSYDEPNLTKLMWPSKQQINSFERNWSIQMQQFLRRMRADLKNVFKAKVQSNILTEREQIAIVEDLLPSRVSQMNLLYRASQNDFNIKYFHQNCDSVGNTVLMIRTETDHFICAYTPNRWDNSGSYHPDHSRQAFIYSFNQKRKFTLKDIQKASGSGNNYGPVFGYDDILIPNQANIKPATFNIGKFYSQGEMKQNDQSQWTALSGAVEGNKITLKEWQIYQIVFHKVT